MSYAAQNLIPSTTELGGKSPNIFFEDVMAADDAFLDKAIEGLVLYAFNKGEVCTCPSRALIQESIYPAFMQRCLDRIRAIKQGDPLDRETMIGPQVSIQQLEQIESYVKIGLDEGAKLLVGGKRPDLGGALAGGYYSSPPCSRATTGCGVGHEPGGEEQGWSDRGDPGGPRRDHSPRGRPWADRLLPIGGVL
jgi:aldehyde dehydrogenase